MGKQNLLEKLCNWKIKIILGDDAIWSKNHCMYILIFLFKFKKASYVYLIWNLELGIL